MNVIVTNNQYESAYKFLKKSMQKAKVPEEVQKRQHFIPPSKKRSLIKAAKEKIIARFLRNRMKKEGY